MISTRPSTMASKALLTFTAAGVIGFGLCIGSAVNAQTLRVQKPFILTVGGRGAIGQGEVSYFYTGLSYAFAKSTAAIPTAGYALYQVYVGYAQLLFVGGMGADGGGKDTGPYDHSVGIGPAVAYHFGPTIAPVHPFAGVGVGYYNLKVYDNSNVSRLGVKVFAGLELKSGFLGEIDYTHVGSAGGTNTGGGGARLGYRF